jgi:hypothetical protein
MESVRFLSPPLRSSVASVAEKSSSPFSLQGGRKLGEELAAVAPGGCNFQGSEMTALSGVHFIPAPILMLSVSHLKLFSCLQVPCVMLLTTAACITALTPRTPDQSEPVVTVFDQSSAVTERPADEPRYEWEGRPRFYAKLGASGMSRAERCSLTLKMCTITAMRSCVEWEGDAFTLATKLFGKPLVPLGLLPPSPDGGRGASVDGDDATVRWLDAQPASSVVYVALGSEVPLRVEQVHELALGLELAGTRFLWALRKPSGVVDQDILPPGFQDRTHGRGKVTMGWVPQISILSHGAVGAFLTHCGRNSLIEGLLFGHPLIMLPIFGDQGHNARLMAGKSVGLQVPRDEDDGSFHRHGVASTVRAVMLEEEERRVFVANALNMQKVVADKELHEKYIDEFVHHLRSHAPL